MKKTGEIARFIGGQLVGDDAIEIKGASGLKEAKKGDISFIIHEKFSPLLGMTKASCVVVPLTAKPCAKTVIRVADPSVSFSKAVDFIFPDRIPHPKGIHPTAVIEAKARIGANCGIGPYVVVRDGVSIGDDTVIYPFCYIGKNARLGNSCIIYPGVTIREEVSLGNRVIIHPGAIIGGDGFGYDLAKGIFLKIPQIGTVVVEDDVEIGSNVTIDRARFSRTVIGAGTKIDNLVQVAHNVTIGRNCVVVAQSGISGSTKLGNGVMLGGQAGLVHHIELADGVKVGAQSGVLKSFLEKDTVLWGTPAKPIRLAKRLNASTALLPKLYARLNLLEKKIRALEKKK